MNEDKKIEERLPENGTLPEELDARSGGNKVSSTILFVIIAALSVWAVTGQWKQFSLLSFTRFLSRANAGWITLAVLSMLGFIVFEGLALRSACQALHCPAPVLNSCTWAATDIYFSAITPSATGGQPACALVMMRDAIPGVVTTAALLLTLAMYSLSILTIGAASLLLQPDVFMDFGALSRVLIAVGFAAQAGLFTLFAMLVKNERLLEKLGGAVYRLLGKLRLIRHADKKLERLHASMEEYGHLAELLSGHRDLIARSFLFNLLQRLSQIAVTGFAYLAMGGRLSRVPEVMAMQSYVVIGSCCVPVPGAVGVADYLMLDGFGAFLPVDLAVSMELLSRALSFYSCVLICGIIVFITYRRKKKGSAK